MKLIDDGTNRDSWLASRSVGVGASEVPILFGHGYSESSILGLYASKIGESDPIEPTEGMLLGRRLEGAILEETAERAGVKVAPNKALYTSDALPHCVATPDGFTENNEPCEVKNICHRLDEEDWSEGIPMRYRLQLQTQIGIAGAARGLFGALIFGGKLIWAWEDRDDALIEEIRIRSAQFWKHVVERRPPDPDGSRTSASASWRLSAGEPAVEVFRSEVDEALEQWEREKALESDARKALSAHEKARKAAEQMIVLAMGSADRASTIDGWRFEKRETVRRGFTTQDSIVKSLKITPPREEL